MLYDLLKEHVGHRVEIAQYGEGVNFALEDLDTDEVIFDTDIYDLTAKEPEEYTVELTETFISPYGAYRADVEIRRFGVNDYSVTYDGKDMVRGTLEFIINDVVNSLYG